MLHSALSTTPQKAPQERAAQKVPIAILWDIENCPIPADVNASDVAGHIRMALKAHPAVRGAVTMFSAYGDFNHFPRRLREGCQRTGVNLIDVPNGKKNAADKAILVDMFLFALDNPPPCTILLISGDVDFAPALHKLGQRGYNMVLAVPADVGVSSVLCNAGRFVWDWLSIARGEGLVPTNNQSSEDRVTKFSMHMMGSTSPYGDNSGFLPEDLHRQIHSSTWMVGRAEASVATTGLMPGGPLTLQKKGVYPNVESESSDLWVQPGDLQGLQGQLLRLVKLNRGTLPLRRLHAEYCKLFGRPLYLAEYGSPKLVHLIERMPDAFIVKGEGNKRTLHLKENVVHIQAKHMRAKGNSTLDENCGNQAGKYGDASLEDVEDDVEDIILLQQRPEKSSEDDDKASERKGLLDKDTQEEGEALQDEEEEYMADVRLELFRQQVQELLVSCSCQIPLSRFEALYKQRYSYELNMVVFGVAELELLFEKVADVASVKVDHATNRKFLVANSGK